MRTVWVSRFIGMSMVLAVVGDPGDLWALHRHRAERRKQVLNRFRRLKRTVGEQSMEAHRDPDRGYQVHRRGDREVDWADQPVPEESGGCDGPGERQDYGAEIRGLFSAAHLGVRAFLSAAHFSVGALHGARRPRMCRTVSRIEANLCASTHKK
jgi:hypothetical protein